ncbi:two-component system histidine kinase PnpS [Tepidanaerobacter syntrophicus]|uniref:histidine kinase n=1 Tax=Tepidanaerobacter syntrophicus TaxID=224999 RepID=A0A0U9HGH1_9FIRM|nr:ATP-binding protein [Tepidanaerobacter syntrophicus]GAQ25789.1 two-component system, OmpR family, phosphate regulon sensor histidine kinase PhoR [Tepidanaerobacter syntrophicus]
MRRNIFAACMIIVLISLSITGYAVAKVVEDYFIQKTEDDLETRAFAVRPFLALKIKQEENTLGQLETAVKELGNEIKTRITIVDIDGNVIADSEKDPSDTESHSTRPEIKEAYLGNIGKSVRYSSSLKTEMMYVAIPILENHDIAYVLRLAVPISHINALTRNIWKMFFSASLAGLLVAFLISTIFSRRITKPIEEVSYAAKKISCGNYDLKVPLRPPYETKILAESFNRMAENLQETVGKLKEETDKTRAVLASMAEGLIAVDQNCRVVMMNFATERLFKIRQEETLGKHLLEVLRNRELHDLINEVLKTRKGSTREIKINTYDERIFWINVVPIDKENNLGAVAVMRDITELKRLEKMKSDFVSNVSHELKTPLTSISGFAETLLDGAYKSEENCRYFLRIIKQETDRMTRLINELLYLSRIEKPDFSIPKRPVNIASVVNKAVKLLQKNIDDKGHLLNLRLPENLGPVTGDEDSVLEIIINLLDNAIKYTPEGGNITVEIEDESDFISISVADNGIGIAGDELERIFGRFYRVQGPGITSASGTGLGLAVVKHLVESLNGKISVESQLGKGSTFKVSLPKYS